MTIGYAPRENIFSSLLTKHDISVNYARTVFGDMFVVAHLKKYEQVWLSTLCYDGIVSLDAQSSFSGFLIDRL